MQTDSKAGRSRKALLAKRASYSGSQAGLAAQSALQQSWWLPSHFSSAATYD